MKLNLVGPFVVNAPFGTEIAFAKGLRSLGHEVIEVDPNIDREMICLQNTADATIVFKSCVGAEKYLKSLKHPIVVYQPDDARFTHIREMMLMMSEFADLFLSFDEHGATIARSMGYRAAETLLLTADPELYCPGKQQVERDIDVSFIGSLGDPIAHASRRKMLEIVQQVADHRGWTTAFGQTQDIPTILDIYRRSKVVLNHATDVGQPFGKGYGVQCRHFEVGMTGTAIISNSLYSPVLHRVGLPFYTFSNADELITGIEMAQQMHQQWAELLSGQIKLGHMPHHRAEQLIDFIERNA